MFEEGKSMRNTHGETNHINAQKVGENELKRTRIENSFFRERRARDFRHLFFN